MTVSLRYALYFTPAPDSAWARFGAQWFARADPLLDHPRRYGFHATLKAPFRLRSGARLDDLAAALHEFARARNAFRMPRLRLARLEDFLALVPERPDARLDALAADCVRRFDAWRAPLSAAELDRRRREPLTQRQEALLARWGYPHVLEEYRFHLSLTGPLRGATAPEVAGLPEEALTMEAISLCEEPAPGAAFRVLERAPFARPGRLVYVVGASGSGKDALIAWVRERNPTGVAFAQRRITRPVQAGGEQHVALEEATLDAAAARGEFAMYWSANGLRYGIGREIDDWLAQGLTVVVNGSREHLPAPSRPTRRSRWCTSRRPRKCCARGSRGARGKTQAPSRLGLRGGSRSPRRRWKLPMAAPWRPPARAYCGFSRPAAARAKPAPASWAATKGATSAR